MPVDGDIRTLDIDGYQVKTVVKRNPHSQLPPLMILNGVGSGLRMLQPFFDCYQHSDLISFEVPKGQGWSSNASLWRMKNHARVVKGILDELGIEQVNLLGYSWGGALAQQFVRMYPEQVNKLILAATSPGHTMVPGKLFLSPKVLDPRLYLSPKKLFKLIAEAHPQEFKVTHLNTFSGLSVEVYINQLLALSGWSSLLWLHRIQQPTQIFHAADDRLVSAANARIINTLLPNAQMTIYPSGGHMFVFNHFERFMQDLAQFTAQ